MYSMFSSCLLQCCPNGQLFFVPILRRNRPHYGDDEFEKYEPRPKIVIHKHDFDSIQSEDNNKEIRAPRLQVTGQYVQKTSTVIVKIISMHACQSFCDDITQVQLSLGSHKSKQHAVFVKSEKSAVNQTFSFPHIDRGEALTSPIRFRVYSGDCKSRMGLKAEGMLEGGELSLNIPTTYTILLNKVNVVKSEISSVSLSPPMHRVSNGSVASGDSRRSSMVDSSGRFCSQPTNGAPELLIGLCYDTDHGCLTVGIERGSSLGEKSRPADTFIKIVAVGEFGNELWRQKTELVKGSSEPHYNYSATIQLHRTDLDICTVRIEVWSSVGVLRRRQMLGWLAMGLNSSSPDAQEHWQQMIQGSGITVTKWHHVHPPE